MRHRVSCHAKMSGGFDGLVSSRLAMRPRLVLGLLLAATMLNGAIGGVGLVRTLVDMPAWRRVGVLAWADFSRNADLGNGLFVYPLLGVGGALAAGGAAVAYRLSGRTAQRATAPLYLGAVFAIAGMVTTAFA